MGVGCACAPAGGHVCFIIGVVMFDMDSGHAAHAVMNNRM